jgi:ERCC4-type nuclease
MILMTESKNDADLYPLFGGLAYRGPVPYGDFVFSGLWTRGVETWVSMERKRTGDLIDCIQDGRYLAQAQAAKESGFDFLVLIAEGVWRKGPDGLLQTPGGIRDWRTHPSKIEYRKVTNFLLELDFHVGIKVLTSRTPRETVQHVVDTYLLFQDPPEDHHILEQIFMHDPPKRGILRPPSLVRKVASLLPGVGWHKSEAVDREFRSVREMVMADRERWLGIDGIGEGISLGVNAALGSFEV